jgi:hypothetical protein
MWQDVSSYSQGDKKRIPNRFQLDFGILRASLVWCHRDFPDTWIVSVYGIFQQHDLHITKYDPNLAQRKALLTIKKTLGDALAEIDKEMDNSSSNNRMTKCGTTWQNNSTPGGLATTVTGAGKP